MSRDFSCVYPGFFLPRTGIQDILSQDSNLRNADAELQQRASEYLQLSKVASLDVLATVLEEMPPFPEKESSGLLNLLKKKRPGRVPDNPEIKLGDNDAAEARDRARKAAAAQGLSFLCKQVIPALQFPSFPAENSVTVGGGGGGGASADLLGLGLDGGGGGAVNGNGALVGMEAPTDNLNKFYCKNNGVLYENDVIQIGVKTECRSNLARLALFYGNKTSSTFLVKKKKLSRHQVFSD